MRRRRRRRRRRRSRRNRKRRKRRRRRVRGTVTHPPDSMALSAVRRVETKLKKVMQSY